MSFDDGWDEVAADVRRGCVGWAARYLLLTVVVVALLLIGFWT
jgi:hypothetical protein